MLSLRCLHVILSGSPRVDHFQTFLVEFRFRAASSLPQTVQLATFLAVQFLEFCFPAPTAILRERWLALQLIAATLRFHSRFLA